VPAEESPRFAHSHILEVGELEQLALLSRQLRDRLLHLAEPIELQRRILRTVAQIVGDRAAALGRDESWTASLGLKKILGPSPGAVDDPAGGVLDLDPSVARRVYSSWAVASRSSRWLAMN